MPNLFIKASCDLEMSCEEGFEINEPVSQIRDLMFRYVGFTDVAHDYDISVDEDSYPDTLEVKFENLANNKIRLTADGYVKVNVKADLHYNIFEDSNPKVTLASVEASPFTNLIASENDSDRNDCQVFAKKPK